MVSSELCKKRRVNQDFPTMRDSICHTREQTWPIYGELHSLPATPTTFLLWTGGVFARHKFWCPSGKEDLYCPLLSKTCWNWEPSPATLSVPSGEQLGCPPSSCKQQATRKTLTWWMPKSCQGQDTDCDLLNQHLATAWTCPCRDKTAWTVWYGSKSSSGQHNGPLLQKVCKISIDKIIKLTAKFPDTLRN